MRVLFTLLPGCRVVRLLRDRVSVRASSRLALRGRDCRAAARTRTRGVARFDPTRATTGRAEIRRRNAERLALSMNGDVPGVEQDYQSSRSELGVVHAPHETAFVANSWLSFPDAGRGNTARSHHGQLHHVFRPDKRPSTHRHPLRKVSSGLALRGSVAGSDPAAARPNESVMLGPSAVNTAKPASPSSRWSQALPVEGVTPADMAVCPWVSEHVPPRRGRPQHPAP